MYTCQNADQHLGIALPYRSARTNARRTRPYLRSRTRRTRIADGNNRFAHGVFRFNSRPTKSSHFKQVDFSKRLWFHHIPKQNSLQVGWEGLWVFRFIDFQYLKSKICLHAKSSVSMWSWVYSLSLFFIFRMTSLLTNFCLLLILMLFEYLRGRILYFAFFFLFLQDAYDRKILYTFNYGKQMFH